MSERLKRKISTLKGREELMDCIIMKYHTMPRSKMKTIPKEDREIIEALLEPQLLDNDFFFKSPAEAQQFEETTKGKARNDCRKKYGFHNCWSCDEWTLDDLIVHIQCPIKANHKKYALEAQGIKQKGEEK